MTRTAKPTCEAQTGWVRTLPATPAICRQVVGLRILTAPDGSEHRFCGAQGHRERVERRIARVFA
jgi:hypothetical protein